MTLRDVLAQYPRAHLVVPTLWEDLLRCADELEAALPDLLYAAGEHASIKGLLADAQIEGLTVYQQVETLVAGRTAGDWQLIETAPKEAVLLYRPGLAPSSRVSIRRASDWCGEACCPSAKPTHWIPLPSAPRAQGESPK